MIEKDELLTQDVKTAKETSPYYCTKCGVYLGVWGGHVVLTKMLKSFHLCDNCLREETKAGRGKPVDNSEA